MLNRQLPHTINVKKLAEQGIRLDGELPVGRLQRVLDSVESAEGQVYLELAFHKDEQGVRVAKGNAKCSVNLLCQRCLKPLAHSLEANFSLAFIYTEAQEEQLPDQYDPVMMLDDNVQLVDLIEDDLILALPIVANHTDSGCDISQYQKKDIPELNQPARENPFKVLEALKNTNLKSSKTDSSK
ncbi:MAG: DUF177 domain-containing protein [Pseudomonadales bacterium]|nr:DUF177 domain-containing protein [Pseudomonadales bacterium]